MKHTSPEIQNEILEIMSLQVLCEIAQNIQSSVIYSIMADETADISSKKQLICCIRWVDDNLRQHEKFTGIDPIVNISAGCIVSVVKDMLL